MFGRKKRGRKRDLISNVEKGGKTQVGGSVSIFSHGDMIEG